MAGFGSIFGPNGVLEQLVLWGVAARVIEALGAPAFTALQQDVQAKRPELALSPELAAAVVARHLAAEGFGRDEAAKGGVNAERFAVMVQAAKLRLTPEVLAQVLERHFITEQEAIQQAELQGMSEETFAILRQLAVVRLGPADVAEAVLRSYMTMAEAEAEVGPQGYTPERLRLLANLAGDAPGPDQLVTALIRGIIGRDGSGPDSTSFLQGIAETRLHDKWAPVLEQLGNAVLSPADAASAVIRNFLAANDGEAAAAESGVSPSMFATLRHLAGDAPASGQLAEALRRKLIDRDGTGPESTSFRQGIAEGRLADKWTGLIEGLAKLWPTPVDALDAALKGQITPEEGKQLYELLGGDLQFYAWLLSSQGEGPTPLEAVEMANRGIIPWDGTGPEITSYAQAVRESRYRNKWAAAYKGFAIYMPPPSEVASLLERGAIGQDTAIRLWHKSGLDRDTVSAYLQAAAFDDTAQQRGLGISEVLDMYYGQLIDQDQARRLLGVFHVPDHTMTLLFAYADMRRGVAAVTSAVRRIQSLITARKIDEQTAREALIRLKIPGDTIDELLQTWLLEASISVKVLTETQVIDAWTEKVITQAEAEIELQALGYTAWDAYVLLSIKNKAPLPNPPPRNVAKPLGAVTPGVT